MTAMVPPHLVEKWAREAFLTLPGIRVFLLDDLRNGSDENTPHGVNEVRLKRGRIVRGRKIRSLGRADDAKSSSRHYSDRGAAPLLVSGAAVRTISLPER